MKSSVSTLIVGVFLSVVMFWSCQNSTTNKILNEAELESLYLELDSLLYEDDPQSESLLRSKVDELLSSDQEDVVVLGHSFYELIAKDSLTYHKKVAELIKKFPKGIIERDHYVLSSYMMEDPVKKEKLYKDWIKKYPPTDYDLDERAPYTEVLTGAITGYIEMEEFGKVKPLLDQFIDIPEACEAFFYIDYYLQEAGQYELRQVVLDKAIVSIDKWKDYEDLSSSQTYVIEEYEPLIVSELAQANMKSGQIDEAEKYFNRYNKLNDGEIFTEGHALSYSDFLLSKKNGEAAVEVMKNYISEGVGSADTYEKMKEAYIASHGSANGYAALLSEVQESVRVNIRKEIKEELVNEEFPDFELTDMKGQVVSKSDIQGKIAVLDFWATWCGPCIGSFPGMHAAQTHYANDDDVVFLFINTKEGQEGERRKKAINSVLKRKKVTDFRVLLDEAIEGEDAYVLDTALEIEGIPQKYFLDKNGNIRYTSAGSSGVTEYEKEYVIQVVETIKNL